MLGAYPLSLLLNIFQSPADIYPLLPACSLPPSTGVLPSCVEAIASRDLTTPK